MNCMLRKLKGCAAWPSTWLGMAAAFIVVVWGRERSPVEDASNDPPI